MIRNCDVFIPAFPRSFDHFLRRIFSVAPRGMHVKIAADILKLNDVRQLPLSRSFDLTRVFAEYWRDERQSEFFEDFFLLGTANALIVGIKQTILIQLESLLDGAFPHADIVGFGSGE